MDKNTNLVLGSDERRLVNRPSPLSSVFLSYWPIALVPLLRPISGNVGTAALFDFTVVVPYERGCDLNVAHRVFRLLLVFVI